MEKQACRIIKLAPHVLEIQEAQFQDSGDNKINDELFDETKLSDYASPNLTPIKTEADILFKIQKLAYPDKIKSEYLRIENEEKETQNKLFGNPEELKQAEDRVKESFFFIAETYYKMPRQYLSQLSVNDLRSVAEMIFLEKNWIQKAIRRHWGKMLIWGAWACLSAGLITLGVAGGIADRDVVQGLMLFMAVFANPIMIFMTSLCIKDDTFGIWSSFRNDLKFLRKYRGTHFFPTLTL